MCYPTEEQLKTIKEFDLTKRSVKELLDFVGSIWHWPDWGFKREDHKFELHTGGWSGNEAIMEALQGNFLFWSMYWQSSRRGGHYSFDDSMVIQESKGFTAK